MSAQQETSDTFSSNIYRTQQFFSFSLPPSFQNPPLHPQRESTIGPDNVDTNIQLKRNPFFAYTTIIILLIVVVVMAGNHRTCYSINEKKTCITRRTVPPWIIITHKSTALEAYFWLRLFCRPAGQSFVSSITTKRRCCWSMWNKYATNCWMRCPRWAEKLLCDEVSLFSLFFPHGMQRSTARPKRWTTQTGVYSTLSRGPIFSAQKEGRPKQRRRRKKFQQVYRKKSPLFALFTEVAQWEPKIDRFFFLFRPKQLTTWLFLSVSPAIHPSLCGLVLI